VAEVALDASKDTTDSTVTELTKQVAVLVDQLHQQPRQLTAVTEATPQGHWDSVDAIGTNNPGRD